MVLKEEGKNTGSQINIPIDCQKNTSLKCVKGDFHLSLVIELTNSQLIKVLEMDLWLDIGGRSHLFLKICHGAIYPHYDIIFSMIQQYYKK